MALLGRLIGGGGGTNTVATRETPVNYTLNQPCDEVLVPQSIHTVLDYESS